MQTTRKILLIISGGIAAYKSLELIRLLKKSKHPVQCILTKGGANFVTPLSVSALSENPVYTDLWSLKDETEMGHIRLSREADLIIVAPASADIIAKIACGFANDLATTTLLAANKPIIIAPAMNPQMWHNIVTQDNLHQLQKRGMHIIPPDTGDMACGETGNGRLPEAAVLFKYINTFLNNHKCLNNISALVTSGPTYEPVDPVRFIGNRSSGKQGHAIARALQQAGAHVTLITGPVALPDPADVTTLHVETAAQMMHAVKERNHNIDVAICAAAPSDWRPATNNTEKIKKNQNQGPPLLTLVENEDILAAISTSPSRPKLVIGFAAETQDVIDNGRVKLKRKGCDWILANDVSDGAVFGQDETHIHLINAKGTEDLGLCTKKELADNLVQRIAKSLKVT